MAGGPSVQCLCKIVLKHDNIMVYGMSGIGRLNYIAFSATQ